MQISPLTHQTAPLSRAIADRVIALERDQVPQDVWDYLKLCLADAVGIAFASRAYDFAHKSLDSLNLLIFLWFWRHVGSGFQAERFLLT